MIWLNILTLICSSVNIILFIFWSSLIRIDSAPDGKIVEYASSQISLHVTVLGTIIGVGGLFFAVLGVIGFQSISQMLAHKADKVAREVAAHYVEKAGTVHVRHSSVLPDISQAKEARD
jgi:hypothetical protein